MTTATAPKLSAKDKAFRKAYGHLPSECLPGCDRPRSNGETTHRQSLKRPGDMMGKPFSETWADMKARKAATAAGGNGPVVQVQAPQVQAPQAPSAPDQTARILTLLENITNQLNIQDIRLNKLESGK